MVVASQQQIYQLNYPAQLSQASTKTHTFPLRIKVLSQQLRRARDLVVPPCGLSAFDMAESPRESQHPACWKQPCSDEHLAKIATWITDWRAVSPFLGLTEAEEITILESTHSVPARKMAMLRKWKQKRGAKATYKRLCQAFSDCSFCDLEEKVIELLTKCSSSSSSDAEGIGVLHYDLYCPMK